jgi:N-acyl-D-aspartate/D-glutamate deacylase
MAFYNFPLRLLKMVRDAEKKGAPVMPIEKAVWRLTGEIGEWFGVDAGVLGEGKRADVAVIDPAKLDASLGEYHEAPIPEFGGLNRMVNRGQAVDSVLINGKVAFGNGEVAKKLGKERGYGTFLRAGVMN